MTIRIVSIGDSFTEGMNDYLDDGTEVGWADRVAAGLAAAHPDEDVWYANLAIRGRKIERIVTEQLDAALALDPPPTHLTFNGGGNDMLRPGFSDERMRALTSRVLDKCAEKGVYADHPHRPRPLRPPPGRQRMRRLGTHLTEHRRRTRRGPRRRHLRGQLQRHSRPPPRFWSEDRLHLTSLGHQWIASRVLTAMGVPTESPTPADAQAVRGGLAGEARYWWKYVVPWMGRRLIGRSSGDGRSPKYPTWTLIPPA